MLHQLHQIEVNPLRDLILKAKIPLWKLRHLLNGEPSEATLSRMLRGIEPMPEILEERIKSILFATDKEAA